MALSRDTPDSGWAWIVLIVTFLLQMMTASFTYTVGILKMAFLDKYGEDPIKTDWVGSFHVAISQMSGPFVSLALSRYHCRTVVFLSGIVSSLGFFLSVFVDKMDFLFLTYGTVAAIGQGFCYTTSVVSLGYYFKKRLYFASGIAATGAGMGLMLFPPLIQMLIANYGVNNALLFLSGIGLQFCVLGSLIVPNRQEAIAKQNVQELQIVSTESLTVGKNILRNYSYDVYLLSLLFWNLAYAFLAQSLPLYSSFTGNSREEAALLLSLTGLGSIFGRLLGGIAANDGQIDGIIFYFGPNGVFGLLSLLFPMYGKSYIGQSFYAVAFGLYSGSSITVQGPIVVRLVGVEMLAAGYGVLMFVTGIGSLTGPPFGGWMMTVVPFLEVGFFAAGISLLLACITGMMIIILEKRRLDAAVERATGKTRSRSLSINKFGTSIYTLNDLTLEVTKESSGRFTTETIVSGGRVTTDTEQPTETSNFL